MLGTARLYAPSLRGAGGTLLLPAGALVYIAVPPARDFATSGLENGLVICWIALLWLMLVRWSQRRPETRRSARDLTDPRRCLRRGTRSAGAPRARADRRPRAGHDAHRAGLTWRVRVALIVVGRADCPVLLSDLPDGLLRAAVPNTAVAKDAAGAKWCAGIRVPRQLRRAVSAVGAGPVPGWSSPLWCCVATRSPAGGGAVAPDTGNGPTGVGSPRQRALRTPHDGRDLHAR